MSLTHLKEFTLEEVAEHNKEGDLVRSGLSFDSKVYDLTRFANLHPWRARTCYLQAVWPGKMLPAAFFGLHRHEVLLRSQYARLQIGSIRGREEHIKSPEPGAYLSPDNHRRFHHAVRAFFMKELHPEALRCEESGKLKLNFLAMRLGPGKYLKGLTLMGGIDLLMAYSTGGVIALPPIFNYGTPELQMQYVPDILAGKKYIALAITEAFAGSDVAGVQTTAVREGNEWVITGTKKWITNGTFADYFTTLCQTDSGPTVILVPRSSTVSTKPVKTSYSATAGTAYVTFSGTRVPVSHTLGGVGQGWTNQRMAFGKPLNAQPVIRARLALMIERVEACQSWVENITYQMNHMTYAEQSDKLAGPIALLKTTAEDAAQIFGGRGITFHRTSPFDAILAGAEDCVG
ncbi:acyl-CoA dehydrogenase/oxidase [Pisolithus tinctorius]|nr:acyl-CoA dehydrogenase/oxidase [Pisolithus tinctorius]